MKTNTELAREHTKDESLILSTEMESEHAKDKSIILETDNIM